MTLIAQELPKVGLVMESVKVIRWLKAVGENVARGENLLEVETEKSIVEIEAGVSGRLAKILVQADEDATVGDRIAWIESSEPLSDTAAPGESVSTTGASATGETVRDAAGDTRRDRGRAAVGAAAVDAEHGVRDMPRQPMGEASRIRSSPAARKLAASHGIDVTGIAGTGPAGRVQIADVQSAIDDARADATGGAAAGGAMLSPMRRALARAMSLSNATIPQFNVASSVDWSALKTLRGKLAGDLPAGAPPLSLNDFLLQAVARSLMEFPGLNATFAGDLDAGDARLLAASGVHLGLVVAVDNGLLVPVIHDVETLGLAAIARRRVECVGRALQGRLPREAIGATFSISNLGAAGPERFTALINPPQSAILAVGRQLDCVVAREGAVVVRPMSELTLTVDHRVADGRLASMFLARVITLLEGADWRLE
jgi:pyruvate dehydrogenase E2 component (dihydrolipoamide acetyltransferase)